MIMVNIGLAQENETSSHLHMESRGFQQTLYDVVWYFGLSGEKYFCGSGFKKMISHKDTKAQRFYVCGRAALYHILMSLTHRDLA